MADMLPYDENKWLKNGGVFGMLDLLDYLLAGRSSSGRLKDDIEIEFRENESEYIIEIRPADSNRDDIRVDFDMGRMFITVDSKAEKRFDENGKTLHEMSYRSLQRVFFLKNADIDNMTTSSENDRLIVTVPKRK